MSTSDFSFYVKEAYIDLTLKQVEVECPVLEMVLGLEELLQEYLLQVPEVLRLQKAEHLKATLKYLHEEFELILLL